VGRAPWRGGRLTPDRDESPIAAPPPADDGVGMGCVGLRGWAACATTVALLAGAAPAHARDDDSRREARVEGTCAKGASSKLRLRSRDGEIRVEFDLKRNRSGERWRVVLVHERRVAWRGTVRTRSSGGSLRVRRTLRDYEGSDRVTVRASGPRGLTCEATARLAA